MKSTEASINELLNLSKGIICHVFTKCPEKTPTYTSTPVNGLFEVSLAIPGVAFPIDKNVARQFTATATQKQVAEKWAALFGCLALKKEGVFPDYAAQFLHSLNGIEDAIEPFYIDMCQKASSVPKQQKKNKQTNNDIEIQPTLPPPPLSTSLSLPPPLSLPNPIPLPSPLPPQQYEPQTLEDHQIIRKAKRKAITDTQDDVFDFRIRSKSDLQGLGVLECVCRFCKTSLCLSSELSIDANAIWCNSTLITTQISELLDKVSKISDLQIPKMTSDEFDSLCTTKSPIEFSNNPQKTQKTLPFLVHCKNCHEHIGVLELPDKVGRIQFTRDTICFVVRKKDEESTTNDNTTVIKMDKNKRVLISGKTWKKLTIAPNESPAAGLAKKTWFVYNIKSKYQQQKIRYPHLSNQFLHSYYIFCTKPLLDNYSKITFSGSLILKEEEIVLIREIDKQLHGGLCLIRKTSKSDQWNSFIVPLFLDDESNFKNTIDIHTVSELLVNGSQLLVTENCLKVLNVLNSLSNFNGMNAIFQYDQEDKENRANMCLRNRILRTPYNNRAYSVTRVAFELSLSSFMPHTEKTFKEYYQQKGTEINDSTQPMIEIDMTSNSMISEKGARKIRNESERFVHLVPELSELTGFTQELKEATKIYKTFIPPAWEKRKFDRNLDRFETTIGVKWDNKELIAQAFDFTSLAHQRLEFLGDSVLDFVVDSYYFIKKPLANEAKLSLLRAKHVSNENLNKIALSLHILKCMPTSQDKLAKLLANVMEAVIGALFLDKGLQITSEFIYSFIVCDPSFCKTLFTQFAPPSHYDLCAKPSEEKMQHIIRLEQEIGYSFKNKSLLFQALTHPTMFNPKYLPKQEKKPTKEEINQQANLDYERFEFLGDMLIKFFIGVHFYAYKPNMNAGDLSFLRHIYVMNDYFAQKSVKMNVPEVVIKPDSYQLPSITSAHSYLGDIFEAITCAIYLDSGGFIDPEWKGFQSEQSSVMDGGPAAHFIRTTIINGMSQEDENSRLEMITAKNSLQQHFSKLGPNVVKYRELPSTPHSNLLEGDAKFLVGVYVNDVLVGQGKGSNKQTAEKMAALDAYSRLCK